MIDIDVLKILEPHHIKKLFRNQTIGEQAAFEHNLKKWKEGTCSDEPTYNILQSKNSTKRKQMPSLLEILSNTCCGKQLLQYYKENRCLYEEQRNLLINTITKYIESNGLVYSLADCNELEKEICAVFPTEELVRKRIYLQKSITFQFNS